MFALDAKLESGVVPSTTRHPRQARDPPDSGPVFYVGISGLDFRVAGPPEPIAKFLAEANGTYLR